MGGWRVSFGGLKIGETARNRVEKALSKNWVTEGENVKEFEDRFRKQFGYRYAVATSSGTSGLIASLLVLYEFGAKRGDEVIVPALTFVATANAVLVAGFTPKFVDVELETLNINPDKIEEVITDRTVAIIPVHLMGKSCNMDEILSISREKYIWIIEDGCEAHGAKYKGKYVGKFGAMSVFSFYPAHMVVAGEGGMVVTDDEEIANLLCSVKSHGRPTGLDYFDFQRQGLNLRMNDLTAAIGIEGIENFEKTFECRTWNLNFLLDLVHYYGLDEYCYFIKQEADEQISPHAFPIVLRDDKYNRDELYRFLEARGIQCKTLFGSLPTQHKALQFLGYKLGDFPTAEYIGRNGLHFGIHQYLEETDLRYVAEVLNEYFIQFRWGAL